ncbi:MAG TPA: hypothetical protein VMK32_02940 [Burkholderiaceae bacterium]|nr:hypothetical protein [Burkholderiaceae bacterium]
MIAKALPLPLRAGLTAALAVALLAGCGKKDEAPDKGAAPTAAPTASSQATTPPATPTDREVRITEIRPELGALKVGQAVRIAISGTYKLPSDGGTVGIVVQDAKHGMVTSKLIPVSDSSGSFTQEIEFKVPATEQIFLHVPLYLKGDTKSATVASREWAVKEK